MPTRSPAVAQSDERIPVLLLRAVMVLLCAVLLLVAFASLTDRPLEAQPPGGEILAEKLIHLEGTMAGAARVLDENGEEIAQFAPGKGGFMSTIDRVIRRERQRHGVASDGVLHLRLREGDRVSLFDPLTGKEMELESFGHDNIAKFTVLLGEG